MEKEVTLLSLNHAKKELVWPPTNEGVVMPQHVLNGGHDKHFYNKKK